MQATHDRIQNGHANRQKLNEEEKKFLKSVYVSDKLAYTLTANCMNMCPSMYSLH